MVIGALFGLCASITKLSVKTYVDIAYFDAYVNAWKLTLSTLRETKMKTLSIAALAAALLATPIAVSNSMADTVTISAERAGQTLQSGDIAMSLYFTKAANDGFEVVATYVGDTEAAQPQRIVINLSDGDRANSVCPDMQALFMSLHAAATS